MCKVAEWVSRAGVALTSKTEKSQALARIVIISLFATYFAITQPAVIPAISLFAVVAVVWAVWVHYKPSNNFRSFVGCVLDPAGVSAMLFLAGPGHPGLILMYFWLLIGNGYRFTLTHASISAASTLITFWIAVLLSDVWVGHLSEAFEVTLGFTLIAWFTSKLMHNLEESLRAVQVQRRRARQLETKVLQDGLTGLCNREFALDLLTKLAARGTKAGVMFIDLDNFKHFNDEYGHHVGDQVLINIGKRLQNCVRENDYVCRYAGDEFVVIVSDHNKDTINTIAERIRHELNTPIGVRENSALRITGSVGVAVLGIHADNTQGILQSADAAMYAAKRQGRNQVVWYEDNTNQ
jgi:diguanylate cyclase (GGDEF)-like protein